MYGSFSEYSSLKLFEDSLLVKEIINSLSNSLNF